MAKIIGKLKIKIVMLCLSFARWMALKEFESAIMRIARPLAINMIRAEYGRERVAFCSIPSCISRSQLKKVNGEYYCKAHGDKISPIEVVGSNTVENLINPGMPGTREFKNSSILRAK